jgi:hypothetical protein
VHNLAVTLVVLLLIVPLALVLFVWLPMRVRWIRRASYATALRAGRSGRDLLALRALANQPLRRLAGHRARPGERVAGRRRLHCGLAGQLELRTLGLRGGT